MIEHLEKSGDYGAAIRGDEKTAAWAATDPGVAIPTTSRDVSDGGMNKVAVTLGSVVLIALVLLCFRLAYDSVRTQAAKKGFTTPHYGTGEAESFGQISPRSPVGVAPIVAPPAAPLANLPAPPAPVPAVVETRVVWASESERAQVVALLDDFHAAYHTSGELSREWFAAVGAIPAQETAIGKTQRAVLRDATAITDASESSTPPRFLSAKERQSINAQIEGLTVSAGLSTQPARYPLALQETATEAGRELRTYLETVRVALGETDATERSAAQARAETHRARSGELLTSLETAVKNGVVAEMGQ